MKKFLILAAIAVSFSIAQNAQAQIFGGWFAGWRSCSTCSARSCSACQAVQKTEPAATCETCPAGATCLVDPVGREEEPTVLGEYKPEPIGEPAETCEPCGACETCSDVESCETCSTCPLSALESALVREINRVRGSRVALRFDCRCNSRAQRNANAQATLCRLGHFSGDPNEIAGRGYSTPAAAVHGWLNSPAHRAIMLRADWTKIGACARRGRDGLIYWSVNFGK